MAENSNDQQFRQNKSGQHETLSSEQNQGNQYREGTTSESQMDRELYEEDDPNSFRDQEQNEGSQPYRGSSSSGSPYNRERFDERGSSPTATQQDSQGRDEYASPDEFDELEDDELDDNEMISRVDEEDDTDILDDDENPEMNRQGI